MKKKPSYEELEKRVQEFVAIEKERRHDRDASFLSEEKLRAAFEANPDPFVVYDNEGRVIYLNPIFTSVFGWTLEERLGKKMDQFVPAENWPETQIMIDKVISGKRFSGIETRRLTKSGETIPVSMSGSTYHDQEGKLIGSIITLQDISNRKKAEAALRESEARYKTLIDVSPDPLTIYDANGHVTYVNKAFETTFGWTKGELMGKGIDFVPDDEMEKTKIAVGQMMRGESVSLETKRMTKDGRIINIHLKTANYTDIAGNLAGNIIIYRDITDRVRFEENIQKLNEELEQRVAERTMQLDTALQSLRAANKAKSQFLANMSHEIRTPMNGVIGATDLALGENPPKNIERYLKIIRSSGHSLLAIINDILDFTKIEAGKLDIEYAPFRVDVLLRELVQLFLPKTAEKGIDLLIDIEPDATLAVIGDRYRIQQVLSNLISNATKFTNTGGCILAGAVQLEKTVDRTTLQFFVSDTGIGIKSEYLNSLFKPFTQADASTTRRYGGTGLGLTICKQLTELMGGALTVKSDHGNGTTFYVTLSFQKQPAIEQVRFEFPAHISHLRILLIDKGEKSRTITTNILKFFDFEVNATASGTEALALIESRGHETFDLLIADYQMPDMEGGSFIDRLKNDCGIGMPVIFMNCFVRDKEPAVNTTPSVQRFLTKPFDAFQLYGAILEVFGKPDISKKEKQEVTPKAAIACFNKLKGRRILLAEDNLTNQEIAKAILSNAGISVLVAENGKQAVEAICCNDKGGFDAVLMDMQMPVMDGYEATRLIKADPRFDQLPVVAMTAHAMKGDEEKCLGAGMDAYVSKPVNHKQLLSVLCEVLQDKLRPAIDEATANSIQKSLMALKDQYYRNDLIGMKTFVTELKTHAMGLDAVKVKNICLHIEQSADKSKPIPSSLIQALQNEVDALLDD